MSDWLQEKLVTEPELSDLWNSLLEPLSKRLFFQFTEIIRPLPTNPKMQNGKLVNLYKGLLLPLLEHLDLLTIANIAVEASYQLPDQSARLEFLTSTIQDFQSCQQRDDQALVVLNSAACICEIENGKIASGTSRLERVYTLLKSLGSNVDHRANAAYQRARSIHCRTQGDFDGYYSHSMLYLSYVDLSALDTVTREKVTIDISIAALTGSRSYSFNQLLQHPLVRDLERSTQYNWLYYLISCFASADLEAYKAIRARVITESPILAKKIHSLDLKIRVLCITSLICSRPTLDRTFQLSELAELTQLDIVDLELLLLKAFEVNVLQGIIDQTKGTINITYVIPRELTNQQISEELLPQFKLWAERVEQTISTLQGHALTVEKQAQITRNPQA